MSPARSVAVVFFACVSLSAATAHADGGTRIRLYSGYQSGQIGGLALEIAGSLIFTGGLVTAVVPAISPSTPPILVAIGAPLAVAGGAMLVGGIVMRVRNPTGVESFSRGRVEARRRGMRWSFGAAPSADGLSASVFGTF